MVLNKRPERQRSGRGSAADAVQEDVLREETRQLNVALPVELHHRLKVAAAQEGFRCGNGPPGRCSTILQMQMSRIIAIQ